MPLILRTHASAVRRNPTCVTVNQMARTCSFCHTSALGKKYGPHVSYLCNVWVGTKTGFTGFAASDTLSLEFWSSVKLEHGSDLVLESVVSEWGNRDQVSFVFWNLLIVQSEWKAPFYCRGQFNGWIAPCEAIKILLSWALPLSY